jgi:hypothetical protein
MIPKNVLDDPDFQAFLAHAELEMLPKMKESAMSLTVFSGKVDAKLCIEFGAAVLYDKPIVLIALPGTEVPDSLKRCADEIIYGDPAKDPKVGERLMVAIERAVHRRKTER